VRFADGRTVTGTVTGIDQDGDLAVVHAETGDVAPVAWQPEVASASPGKVVFAVAALPGGGSRVTVGTVSGVGRAFRGPRSRLVTDAVEHSAPMGRGSSGGPIVDSSGQLLGINTHRLGDGFYLAVPAGAELRSRVEALSRGESPRRPHLGIAVVPPHAARRLRTAVGLPQRDGVLVRAVEPDSPAGRAGVSQGDLIVAADGRATASIDDLLSAVDALDREAGLSLTVVRGNDELELRVTTEGVSTEGSA
jgi:serine protease Do